MIVTVTLKHAETGEERSLRISGCSRRSINRTARRQLNAPYPMWTASYGHAEEAPVRAEGKVRKPKPSIKDRAAEQICPNCGGMVQRRNARGPLPKFCDARGPHVCKREFETRAIVEGRALAPLLKAWRVDRGQGEIAQRAFSQACQILDQFNAQDHTAKRPRADLYAAKLMVDASLYGDRQRGPRKVRPEPAPAPAPTPEPVQEEQPDLAAILRQIAEGHNDARGLAEEVLAGLAK